MMIEMSMADGTGRKAFNSWILIETLLVTGLLISLYYSYIVEYEIECGCIIGKGLYLSYIMEYSKIFGVRAIDLSVAGFLAGSLLGMLAILGIQLCRKILILGALVAAIILIPYYIYLEISLGFICIYCSALQMITVAVGALLFSIFLEMMKRHKAYS